MGADTVVVVLTLPHNWSGIIPWLCLLVSWGWVYAWGRAATK